MAENGNIEWTKMLEDEMLVFKAKDIVKAGDVNGALSLLEKLHDRPKKPLLYGYVQARCFRKTGDVYRESRALYQFCTSLSGELGRLQGHLESRPQEIYDRFRESVVLLIAGDHRRAIKPVSRVIAWLLDRLQDLGFNPFRPSQLPGAPTGAASKPKGRARSKRRP